MPSSTPRDIFKTHVQDSCLQVVTESPLIVVWRSHPPFPSSAPTRRNHIYIVQDLYVFKARTQNQLTTPSWALLMHRIILYNTILKTRQQVRIKSSRGVAVSSIFPSNTPPPGGGATTLTSSHTLSRRWHMFIPFPANASRIL